MVAGKYGCHQCMTIFEMRSELNTEQAAELKCPGCGSIDVELLPSWIPTGYSLELPLERYYRDARGLTLHFTNSEQLKEMVGKMLLGLPPI